ncbi:MAG: hypothetical protein K2M31_07840 [Muribaculaceae bacterium]|nr:hypothetical protein [Muribaculaceae bacterium]
MDKSIHISKALDIMNSGKRFSIKFWARDGRIIEAKEAESLRYDFYGGWRNIKIFPSKEIRKIRDCLIFSINGMEVFL